MSLIHSVKLIDAATATSTGEKHGAWTHRQTYQATGFTTAGAGAATVQIWVSDVDNPSTATDVDWVLLATISLTLATTSSTDGAASEAAWRWRRAKVSAISGTGASVTVWMGAVLVHY